MKEFSRDKLKQEPVSTLLTWYFIIMLFKEVLTGTLSHGLNLDVCLFCKIEMGASMPSHTGGHSNHKKGTIRGRSSSTLGRKH